MIAASANIKIKVRRALPQDGENAPPYLISVHCNGTETEAHLKQHVHTALGHVGPVYKDTEEVAQILASLLRRHSDQFGLHVVTGASMGGGTAQTLAANLARQAHLQKPPLLVLFDPQLLNNAQAHAANPDQSYDFKQPRGVAITLNHPNKPRKSLMDKMKAAGGYRHPGLLQIRLGLTDTDGPNGTQPKPDGKLLGLNVGYHMDHEPFQNAVNRFTSDLGDNGSSIEDLIARYASGSSGSSGPLRDPSAPEAPDRPATSASPAGSSRR